MNVPYYKYLTQFCRVCRTNKVHFEAISISATFEKRKNLYVNEFIGGILLTCVGCMGTWVTWVGKLEDMWVLSVKTLRELTE